MTVLYLSREAEIGMEGSEIPHEVISDILHEMRIRDDMHSEGKIS